MSNPANQSHFRLHRFLTGLWLIVLLVVVQAPWPYAAACTLLAICLHFAALDGPLIADQAPQKQSQADSSIE